MVKQESLKVEKRTVFGKKVKRLRKQGILPANVFGKSIKSLAVQVMALEFRKLLSRAGETELLDLQIEGEKDSHPVLIRQVQKEPVSGELLHADFLQVDLKEKVTVGVPLKFIGEAPAVKAGRGVLLELKSELGVEALPTDLPSEIEVDISNLREINDAILIKDLKLSKGVEIQANLEDLICKIESQQVAEVEEEKKPKEVATTSPS